MIIIKTIIFLIAFIVTSTLIEDAIEKIILHNKRDGDELHMTYTHGFMSTFDRTPWRKKSCKIL